MTSQTGRDAAANPGGSAIRCRGVSKVFGGSIRALEDVSLEARPQEFVAVVGPSGCGKSTILRLVAGLDQATAGEIEAPSELGYVFQDPTLLPWRTVQRNVELLVELEGASRKRRAQAARDALERVGLDGFEDAYPNQLSGGMKMRASLARALTTAPQAFLLDEPFGALDAITRERMNDELMKLFSEKQFATLFITHSIYEAVYLASTVLVMSPRPGRISGRVDLPWGYPRDPSLRFEREYAEYASKVDELLRTAEAD